MNERNKDEKRKQKQQKELNSIKGKERRRRRKKRTENLHFNQFDDKRKTILFGCVSVSVCVFTLRK